MRQSPEDVSGRGGCHEGGQGIPDGGVGRVAYFTRVPLMSYGTFPGPSMPGIGRQPPEKVLPSSLKVPSNFDASVEIFRTSS